MKLAKEIKTKFEKLDINSFSELALIIPSSYEDLTLHSELQVGSPQLIDATVESVFRAKNSIQITFFVHNFAHTLQGVIFRPKPYMMHQFKEGNRDYYYGVVECNNGMCSINMPKKVTTVGSITPKYKCSLRSDAMLRFIQKYLTKESLLNEGLDEKVIDNLLKLHFPQTVINLKELDKDILEALKYVELFVYMKQLSSKRRYFDSVCSVSNDYKKWAETLPFTLTDEQIKAIEDIKQD
ncbi:MAG: ATP-dependent DNA helicase RecG, partial [Campylobacterales bacterium]